MEDDAGLGDCTTAPKLVVDDAWDLPAKHGSKTVDHHAEGGEPELLRQALVFQYETVEGDHETLCRCCGAC